MTIRDNRDYTRIVLYSYYTNITGWGVHLRQSIFENVFAACRSRAQQMLQRRCQPRLGRKNRKKMHSNTQKNSTTIIVVIVIMCIIGVEGCSRSDLKEEAWTDGWRRKCTVVPASAAAAIS